MMKILINKIRRDKNITLVKLQKKTGIAKSTLNNLENERYSPKMNQMELIAKALDVSINDLFESPYK